MPRRTVLRRRQQTPSAWHATDVDGAVRRDLVPLRQHAMRDGAGADVASASAPRLPVRSRVVPCPVSGQIHARRHPSMPAQTCSRRRRDANHSQRFARVKPIPASRVPSTPVFGEVFFNRLDALRGRLARRNERPPTACTRSFAIVSATCEKSLSHAGFCNTVEFDAAIATTTRAVSLDCAHHTHSVLDSARRAARRRPQDSLFFCCAV